MKKLIKNVFLLVCTGVVVCLIGLFMTHDSPIPVEIPALDAAELAAKKEEAAAAEKEAQRQARARRVYSCKADEDCIIVDKDPCGCAVGPKGVVAINVNYLTDFNALNSQKMVTKSCSEVLSREKECSPSARAVCKAHTCKITY